MKAFACLLAGLGLAASLHAAEPSPERLLQQARTAFEAGRTDEALKLAGQAIEADPDQTRGWLLRGTVHAALGRHREAVADFDEVLRRDPEAAEVYDRRGSEHFKLGEFEKSIADFDKFLELKPEHERSHWRRGISYYYVGRYAEGKKQFEQYQTFDDNDVENAVWCYLCHARLEGPEKARQALLKVKQDPRIPLMRVYALFAGECEPEDVLQEAQAGEPSPRELKTRLFYAHLYLGLYYESAGDARRALEHLSQAVAQDIGPHYMWDVARVHVQFLKQKPGK